MKVRINSLAWLSKSLFSEVDLYVLKRKLIIVPKKTSEFSDPNPIQMYAETDDEIGVPREYFFTNINRGYEVDDQTSMGHPFNSSFGPIKLRDYQIGSVNKFLNYLKDHFGGSFEAVTGFGKTVCGLYISRELGGTTLIVVHKDSLAQQWIKRIKGDPNEDEPLLKKGFMPEASVGLVGDGKVDYQGKDFVIGMIQTLSQKELDDDFYSYFRTVIIDELHRSGAEKWGTVAPKINSRYRIGLSATIRRKDKAENVFFWHIGKIVAKGEKGGVLDPAIYFMETGFSLIETPGFNPDSLTRVQVISALIDSSYRNSIIMTEMMKAVRAKRRIVAVSDRVKHLEKFIIALKAFRDREKLEFTIGEFYKGGRRVTKEDLANAKKRDVVMATFKMIEDGEDVKELDCLFMLTPCSDPEQLTGRILRDKDGKKSPVIVDFIDNDILKCRQLYFCRKRFYAKKGWKVYEVKRDSQR